MDGDEGGEEMNIRKEPNKHKLWTTVIQRNDTAPKSGKQQRICHLNLAVAAIKDIGAFVDVYALLNVCITSRYQCQHHHWATHSFSEKNCPGRIFSLLSFSNSLEKHQRNSKSMNVWVSRDTQMNWNKVKTTKKKCLLTNFWRMFYESGCFCFLAYSFARSLARSPLQRIYIENQFL